MTESRQDKIWKIETNGDFLETQFTVRTETGEGRITIRPLPNTLILASEFSTFATFFESIKQSIKQPPNDLDEVSLRESWDSIQRDVGPIKVSRDDGRLLIVELKASGITILEPSFSRFTSTINRMGKTGRSRFEFTDKDQFPEIEMVAKVLIEAFKDAPK